MDGDAVAKPFQDTEWFFYAAGIVGNVKTDALFHDVLQVSFPIIVIGLFVAAYDIEGLAELGEKMQVVVCGDVGDALVDVRRLGAVVHHALFGRKADGVPIFLYQGGGHTVYGAH